MVRSTFFPAALACLILAGCPATDGDKDNPGTDTGDDSDTPAVEDCSDGVDNDADGALDCADSDCAANAACAEDCSDGIDNDNDGAADCYDTDCTGTQACAEDCSSGEDEDVDGAIDCDDSDCTGAAACLPVLDSVSPAWGFMSSTTAVTITGSGFGWDTAGETNVSFGGAAASNIVVVDANTITALAPASATAGSVDVEVSNSNGSGTLPGGFEYVQPALYLATGTSGIAGNLYRYVPGSSSVEALGALDYSFTGLAFDSNLVLYGTMSTEYGSTGSAKLCTINTSNGYVTQLGSLVDSGGVAHDSVPDITFVGSRLLAWTEDSDQPAELNTSTGAVSVIGGGTGSSGSGLAYDKVTSKMYVAPEGSHGTLYTIDTSTGAAKSVCSLNDTNSYSVNSMTFHQGTLYAVINNYGGGDAALYTINTSTCAITKVIALEGGIDSVASNTN